MALTRIQSVALQGLEAVLVEVEVDTCKVEQEARLVIVGLPSIAVRESKDRVLAAIRNSEKFREKLICTVNLAPGDLKKEGSFYDLPIALGILRSMNAIVDPYSVLSDYLIVGELGLGGEMRPIRGALAIGMLARKLNKKGILLPAANAQEASAIPSIDVIPIHHLNEAVKFVQQPDSFTPMNSIVAEDLFASTPSLIDFSDIKGQEHVKRAMEIAAAGGHNILLSGPPGSGKTMLAKALSGIMPELTLDEALETTKIHSVAGMNPTDSGLVTQRPFRSPHHTVSYAGLIGGGSTPRPGEVSLAHNGILFLDELPEFSRTVLEVLRQPLEDRNVTISRANGNFTYPTNFICVAAMNPCPCGWLGHHEKKCIDTPLQINRYRSKISGPILDRIDMHIQVPALRYKEIIDGKQEESSETVRNRVKEARKRQHARFDKVKTNSLMIGKELKIFAPLDPACKNVLKRAIDDMGMSARAGDRLIRVARTIADLEGVEKVEEEHLLEAMNFRTGLE